MAITTKVHYVCAWCGKGIRPDGKGGRPSRKGVESHGICRKCLKRQFPQDYDAVVNTGDSK